MWSDQILCHTFGLVRLNFKGTTLSFKFSYHEQKRWTKKTDLWIAETQLFSRRKKVGHKFSKYHTKICLLKTTVFNKNSGYQVIFFFFNKRVRLLALYSKDLCLLSIPCIQRMISFSCSSNVDNQVILLHPTLLVTFFLWKVNIMAGIHQALVSQFSIRVSHWNIASWRLKLLIKTFNLIHNTLEPWKWPSFLELFFQHSTEKSGHPVKKICQQLGSSIPGMEPEGVVNKTRLILD